MSGEFRGGPDGGGVVVREAGGADSFQGAEVLSVARKVGAGVDTGVDYRGYEALNRAFINAAVNLLVRLGLAEEFLGSGMIAADVLFRECREGRYLQASLDCLVVCGFLELRSGYGATGGEAEAGKVCYELTERGRALFEDQRPIMEAVSTNARIMRMVKNALCWEALEEGLGDSAGFLAQAASPDADRLHEMWVVPAVTTLHEMEFQSGELVGRNVAEALAEGKTISVAEFTECPERWPHPSVLVFIHVLMQAGLLDEVDDDEHGGYDAPLYYRATLKGKKVFALAGYHELVLSYYQMLQKMDRLTNGGLSYGSDRDVNRDARLNARASSGILEKRVAPYIVRAMATEEVLRARFAGGCATVDFGSGGGEMMTRIVDARLRGLSKVYGIDISHGANTTAQAEFRRLRIEGMAEVVNGSILSEDDLRCLFAKIRATGVRSIIGTINFILHDVGHKAAEVFLRNYARIFGDSPLIVTETMKMSPEVLRAHPNYQATSFQFMHTASGQELFTEPEILALFERCGFKILARKVHSSMPGVNLEERHDTIITFTIQHQGN